LPRFGGPHEGLADLEAVDPVLAHERDVKRGEDAAFGDDDALRRSGGVLPLTPALSPEGRGGSGAPLLGRWIG